MDTNTKNGIVWSNKPFVRINGVALPQPARSDFQLSVMTLVDSTRNSDGVMVGQKVGREQQKITCSWAYLDKDTWEDILQLVKDFYFTVKYPDMSTGEYTSRKMYCGDRSAKPFHLGTDGLPIDYIECKMNLIDVGEDTEYADIEYNERKKFVYIDKNGNESEKYMALLPEYLNNPHNVKKVDEDGNFYVEWEE